ncbi:hypothetical protein CAOG_08547 [Capsaspora owczarzaki ATCC 30864]|uniref:Uncharacterized protein n=1 Tax=Capsaspora owczarzaki (strain ATCC 30864) TaxID=595528 RepID=A0A0D2U5Q3_CAPO3|nr:hypothetical protein CAOG_08547 [Capsaspora owczarzaki ATCC 30864]KJE90471.1 hypothetical protein CAOG_008547 [Capsaspora owczarzaki ATCC 30864]|eukprot:XP_011270129.1 hypothetical protein CAOG_08547 [Capsaspora owczarzaki ATCC 30864]
MRSVASVAATSTSQPLLACAGQAVVVHCAAQRLHVFAPPQPQSQSQLQSQPVVWRLPANPVDCHHVDAADTAGRTLVLLANGAVYALPHDLQPPLRPATKQQPRGKRRRQWTLPDDDEDEAEDHGDAPSHPLKRFAEDRNHPSNSASQHEELDLFALDIVPPLVSNQETRKRRDADATRPALTSYRIDVPQNTSSRGLAMAVLYRNDDLQQPRLVILSRNTDSAERLELRWNCSTSSADVWSSATLHLPGATDSHRQRPALCVVGARSASAFSGLELLNSALLGLLNRRASTASGTLLYSIGDSMGSLASITLTDITQNVAHSPLLELHEPIVAVFPIQCPSGSSLHNNNDTAKASTIAANSNNNNAALAVSEAVAVVGCFGRVALLFATPTGLQQAFTSLTRPVLSVVRDRQMPGRIWFVSNGNVEAVDLAVFVETATPPQYTLRATPAQSIATPTGAIRVEVRTTGAPSGELLILSSRGHLFSHDLNDESARNNTTTGSQHEKKAKLAPDAYKVQLLELANVSHAQETRLKAAAVRNAQTQRLSHLLHAASVLCHASRSSIHAQYADLERARPTATGLLPPLSSYRVTGGHAASSASRNVGFPSIRCSAGLVRLGSAATAASVPFEQLDSVDNGAMQVEIQLDNLAAVPLAPDWSVLLQAEFANEVWASHATIPLEHGLPSNSSLTFHVPFERLVPAAQRRFGLGVTVQHAPLPEGPNHSVLVPCRAPWNLLPMRLSLSLSATTEKVFLPIGRCHITSLDWIAAEYLATARWSLFSPKLNASAFQSELRSAADMTSPARAVVRCSRALLNDSPDDQVLSALFSSREFPNRALSTEFILNGNTQLVLSVGNGASFAGPRKSVAQAAPTSTTEVSIVVSVSTAADQKGAQSIARRLCANFRVAILQRLLSLTLLKLEQAPTAQLQSRLLWKGGLSTNLQAALLQAPVDDDLTLMDRDDMDETDGDSGARQRRSISAAAVRSKRSNLQRGAASLMIVSTATHQRVVSLLQESQLQSFPIANWRSDFHTARILQVYEALRTAS